MNNVDWKKDCNVEPVTLPAGYTLYSRWVSQVEAKPTKFPGARKEWILAFPNGDSDWSLSKKILLEKVPKQ